MWRCGEASWQTSFAGLLFSHYENDTDDEAELFQDCKSFPSFGHSFVSIRSVTYSNSWHCLLWDVYWSFLHFLHSVYYENFAKTVASLCPDMRVFTKKAFIRYLYSSSGLRTIIIMTLLKPPSFQRGQPQQFCVQGSLSEAPLKPSLQPQPPCTASRGFFFRTSFVTQHHTLSTRWF